MRANEFITEIFQPGKKNWEWIRRDNTYASARFSVGDRTYTWQAHGAESDNDGPTHWILEFRIERELVDPDRLDVWGKTGTGNSAEVMSTAVDITREFIKEYGDKISELTFDAKEDSRIGLYAKMIARLLPGWELNQTYNKNFGMEFRLTNPKSNEFITEEINPDILHPEFKHKQVIRDYTYTATAQQPGRGNLNFLVIKAYADLDDPLGHVAHVKFLVRGTPESGYLESMNTWVASEYRGKGIASTIYAYAKMLGNTVKPSSNQTGQGRQMWSGWTKSGDAEHLMKEAAPAVEKPMTPSTPQDLQKLLGKGKLNALVKHPWFQQFRNYEHAFKHGVDRAGFTKVEVYCFFRSQNTTAEGKIRPLIMLEFTFSYNGTKVIQVEKYHRDKEPNEYEKRIGRPSAGWKHIDTWAKDEQNTVEKAWDKHWDNQAIKEATDNTVTLQQLYGGNYPDRDEEFWDYVTPRELGQALTVETMQKHKVLIMLLSQYRAEHIDDITDMLDDDQQAIVQSYTNDPALASKVIVVSDDRIIDGNHRALAAAIKGVPINYVDLAELEEEPIDEAETGTKNAREISNQLRTAGYSHVGSGADATVWAKDDSHVIKILMPEDVGSKAEQVFRKFYEFSIAHPELECVPRFNEVNTIDINGKDYTQIEMEKLSTIPENSFVEGLIWFLSDYTSSHDSWETIERELADPNTWKNYSPKYANTFARTWQSLLENPVSKKTYAMYKQLYTVMQILYNTGRINKFGWDLHTANVMLRQNGQPVIIDPWFSEGTS